LNYQDIIPLAQQGDQTAFQHLFDEHWNYLYNFHAQKEISDDEIEDLCIETFSKAFEKIDSFNLNYNFKTWLVSISKNLYIDQKRKKSIDQSTSHINESVEYADETPSIEDQLIEKQRLKDLRQMIKELKPQYKNILILRYFEELTYSEIAQRTNISLSNAKVLVMRARKKLSEKIENKP